MDINADPEMSDSRRQWVHWLKSFTTYIAQMPDVSEVNKLSLLINHMDAAAYELISKATSYEEVIQILTHTYAKTRYALMSCKQQTGGSLDCYPQKLKRLSVNCNCQVVPAQVHKEEAIRNAFIAGVISSDVRKRLLKNDNLALQTAFVETRSLETAQKTLKRMMVVFLIKAIPIIYPILLSCKEESAQANQRKQRRIERGVSMFLR